MLTQYDDQIPIFAEQSPGNNAYVQAAWDAALNRFMAHYSERENEATVQKVVDESIQLDSRIAAMDRKDAEEMVRTGASLATSRRPEGRIQRTCLHRP